MRTMTDPIRAAAVLAVAGLAFASAAEAVDLRDWGRKFPASERFVVLSQFSNQAVLDKETQLVWQALLAPSSSAVNWTSAQLSCHNATTGGRGGWRLPTYAEIDSVFETDGVKPPAFNGVPSGQYWTATVYPSLSTFAMYINVPTGTLGANDMKSQLRSWCVRGPA